MKNTIICILALFLVHFLPNSTFANELNKGNNEKQLELDEILLDKSQSTYISPKKADVVDSLELSNNNTQQGILPKSNDCICSPQKNERKIFSRLNPIKGLKFLDRGFKFGTKSINAVENKIIKEVDKTPIKAIEKIDGTVDCGIYHLEGAVDKGLDVLDKTVEVPLETIDKVLNTQMDKNAVQEWINGDYATIKYFGMRPIIESHGLTVDSSLIYSPYMKTAGGANGEASTKGYSLFSVGVGLDTEAAKLWKGGKFFALYQRKVGMGLSGADGAMGDYFGFDGWDIPQVNQIGEYWYQQKLFNGKIRMKIGKQDSNTDFGYLNSGWDFVNTAFSVNPNTPLPSFPYTPFGFVFEINPKEWLSMRNGIYSKDSCPYNITEVEFKPLIKKMPGRYMVGAWEMSDSSGYGVATGVENDEVVYNNFNRNYGFYFNFEQMVYKEQKENSDDMQGLVLFGQMGISPSSKNDLSKYGSVGLHYKGLIPKRDNDLAGIAIGCGNFASRLNNIAYDIGGRTGSETVVEAFYRMFITKWFYIQPNVQFINNPSGMYDSSVAVGIRSVITF